MKRARKLVSAVLAVLMVTSAFSALTFSASAAETKEENKITVSSNVADPVTYSYSESSEQFTVTYKFQSDLKLINNQAYVTYDSTKLKLADTNKQKTCVPVFSEGGSTVSNLEKTDKILFNSSSLDLYDFTTESTYFTATFDIVGTGATTIDLTLQVMTATQATSYDDVFDYPEIKLARYDVINKDLFKMTCAGQVTPEVVPTTQPTTVAPTTQPTTQPTTKPTTPVDVPTDGYYVMGDSFKVKLAAAGSDKMVGTIALQKGTYKFKLDNFGTMLGYNKVITDVSNGLSFKAAYSSSVTLNATGGTYTFQVNKSTNTLVVKYNKELPNEYLTGDLNAILSPVEGRTLAIGSVYLEAGSYKFKLSVGNVAYGYNKIVDNTTNGSSISFKSTYGSSVTLNATGGTYTFTLNTATNKLTIGYVAAKDEALDDVHLSGDVNAVLDDNNGANNVATGTVSLEEGTYSFQVYNYGVAYTAGVKVNNAGTKQLSSTYKANITLIATGGNYTFSFNKTTGKLTVEKA